MSSWSFYNRILSSKWNTVTSVHYPADCILLFDNPNISFGAASFYGSSWYDLQLKLFAYNNQLDFYSVQLMHQPHISWQAFHLIPKLYRIVVLCRHRNEKGKIIILPISVNYFFVCLQVGVLFLTISLSILTIVSTATNGCCEREIRHISLFSIILGWFYLIHLSSKLPFIGGHAIVFLKIVGIFLRLTIFALLLVLASLILTFFNAQALVSYI